MAARNSNSRVPIGRKIDPLLPYSIMSEKTKKPRLRMRSLLGHCHYRRVFTWLLAVGFLVTLFFIKSRNSGYDVGSYLSKGSRTQLPVATFTAVNSNGETVVMLTGDMDGDGKLETVPEDEYVTKDERKEALEQLQKMPWLKFPHLDGYFHGLRTIVSKANLQPEYPNTTDKAPLPSPAMSDHVPKPQRYSPYKESSDTKKCYLDAKKTVPAPDLYAYNGVPQHMPDPGMGSYKLLGLRDDICFDRFGRYGPYGLGYSRAHGGLDTGLDTESVGSETIWAETGKIDYTEVNWAEAQDACYHANKHRFLEIDSSTGELQTTKGKMGRIAVVIRTYTGFKWTELAVLNFRALINELSLRSGGEYQVHFLMQVRNVDEPIWSDKWTVQRIINDNVPAEFRGLVSLWSEPQMRLMYPGRFGETIENPSGADIHGIYRSAHFPLQVFALQHPEYEHFWNWEMDMRYLGSYYEFFDRLGKWAAEQPRTLLWERSARYYIPAYHGSWENFTSAVQKDTIASGRAPVFGPLSFDGKAQLRHDEWGQTMMPASCSVDTDRSKCGVGEEADLITLNPLFDTEQSGWVFSDDATGYKTPPPRRCAIITASRLSRRLLMAMHEEVWRFHHTAFSEMFPPTVALHHGMKGVFAPHPVYLDRAWYPFSEIDAAFNAGRDHSTSGPGSPFDQLNEHNHKGTSWYFNSEFAGLIWRRWLGYAQMDGRGKHGGRANEGHERGGKAEELDATSSGRLCMRGVLVHPIKFEHPSEKP
ncbi:hypothetical protein EDB81DRAFT_933242 [Dactylonectria macrodidyma]|uniref:Major facilitator superfamily transporter n=1 Tax=Dactylonectria macrodidyma TaxID=307937 RepID=A0A9P9J3S0_9HYPO|nr:hypothetical protein EDB81DRAFT_933242 [Dactylonectria macrodidyma]